MKRRAALAAGVVSLGLLASGSLAVAASTTPTAGTIDLYVSSLGENTSNITITGAIGDYGKTVSVNAKGKVDDNGNYAKVTLKYGGFTVDNTKLDKNLMKGQFHLNKTNCSFSVGGTGPSTIVAGSGTGDYTGISGALKLTVVFAGIAPKTATGCNLKDNAPTYGSIGTVIGTGKVAFSS